jgi:uncharacterized SAM-binding protein YcdF (DUF218 family)
MISSFLLNPLNIFFWVFVLIFVFSKKHKKALLLVTGLFFFVMSIPIIPKKLIQHREFLHAPQPLITDSLATYHIIVLGAGKNDDVRLEANQRMTTNATARLVEGVKWAHRLPNSLLIGSGPIVRGDISQAELMRQTSVLLGVEQSRIFVQEDVVNTATEARAYVEAFGTQTPLIVCTSALHIPRALKWFKYYGVETVHAAPAYYIAPAEPLRLKAFIPSWSSFGLWQQWGKEVVGGSGVAFRMQNS